MSCGISNRSRWLPRFIPSVLRISWASHTITRIGDRHLRVTERKTRRAEFLYPVEQPNVQDLRVQTFPQPLPTRFAPFPFCREPPSVQRDARNGQGSLREIGHVSRPLRADVPLRGTRRARSSEHG